MTKTGDWLGDDPALNKRMRDRATGLDEHEAQDRMTQIAEERDALMTLIRSLDARVERLCTETRALLERYPTLKLGVKQ